MGDDDEFSITDLMESGLFCRVDDWDFSREERRKAFLSMASPPTRKPRKPRKATLFAPTRGSRPGGQAGA